MACSVVDRIDFRAKAIPRLSFRSEKESTNTSLNQQGAPLEVGKRYSLLEALLKKDNSA